MKKKKRKLSGFGVFVIVLFCSFIVFAVLSLTVLFPIKNITVKGDSVYSAEKVINASDISVGNNVLLISKNGVSKKVSKVLPYIKSVSIKHSLNGDVVLTVTPEQKKYYCNYNNKYLIISEQLKVLEVKTKLNSKEKKLAKIIGVDSCSEKSGEFFEIYDTTKNDLLKFINKKGLEIGFNYKVIDLTNISDISVQIENRLVVKLGTSNEIESKFAHLKEMLNNIEKSQTGVIDLKTWTNEKPEGYFRKQSVKNYFK